MATLLAENPFDSTVFLPFTTKGKEEDGAYYVYGKATGPDLDLDQQICDPEWLAKAMPEYFAKRPTVREMHQPRAVGKSMEMDQQGDDWYIKAKIVEPDVQMKIDEGIYTGFSVGIKAPRIMKDASAPGGRIYGGDVVELSTVDVPCNETAKFVLAKFAPRPTQALFAEIAKDAGGIDKPGHAQHDDVFAQAWNGLWTLIKQEAKEAVELGEDETECVQRLMNAVYALRDYARGEAAEGENVTSQIPNGEQMFANQGASMSADADLTKTPEADDAPPVVDAPPAGDPPEGATVIDGDPVLVDLEAAANAGTPAAEPAEGESDADTKSADADLTKMVARIEELESQLTKAAASEERVAALEAELAEVKKALVPGGPVRVAPPQDSARVAEKAAKANQHKSAAADLRARAEATTDRKAQAGYLELAEDEDRKAAKLSS